MIHISIDLDNKALLLHPTYLHPRTHSFLPPDLQTTRRARLMLASCYEQHCFTLDCEKENGGNIQTLEVQRETTRAKSGFAQ